MTRSILLWVVQTYIVPSGSPAAAGRLAWTSGPRKWPMKVVAVTGAVLSCERDQGRDQAAAVEDDGAVAVDERHPHLGVSSGVAANRAPSDAGVGGAVSDERLAVGPGRDSAGGRLAGRGHEVALGEVEAVLLVADLDFPQVEVGVGVGADRDPVALDEVDGVLVGHGVGQVLHGGPQARSIDASTMKWGL